MPQLNARPLTLVWFPTYRCQLNCSYCVARALPLSVHGKQSSELPAEQWLELFLSCPRELAQLSISGGECTLFPGLFDVLRRLTEALPDLKLTMDTNFEADPRKWLTPQLAERMFYLNTSLHFHPLHERAQPLWEKIAWVKATYPDLCLGVTQVLSQRELPEEAALGKEMVEAAGALYVASTFDSQFLFKGLRSLDNGTFAECTGGLNFALVCPDSAVYRCVGQAYYNLDCLGTLAAQGWQVLHTEALPCCQSPCTSCDTVDKVPGTPCTPAYRSTLHDQLKDL